MDPILHAWQDLLLKRSEMPALLSSEGNPIATFGQIEIARQQYIEKLGAFSQGSILAIQIGNHPDWPALFLACLSKNLVVLPLGQGTQVDTALRIGSISGVVEIKDGHILIRNLITAPPAWEDFQPSLLKLTSGTTAEPRAILFNSHQLLADCRNICATMGIRGIDINFGVIPFSHSYGFSNLITPLLCEGIPLVVTEDRMPRAILEGLKKSGASVFPGMPVFYQMLGAMENADALPSLRLCISAGAPLLPNVGIPFTERFGLKIHTFYGSSECGGICYDASESLDYEEGFVGTPLQNVTVDFDEDKQCLSVRSDAVGHGYYPVSDQALGNNRFTPQDIATKTEKGFYLLGRTTDIINVAGRKLNPMEIETKLLDLKGIKQIAAFGVPSSFRNEDVVVCVASTEPGIKEKILHFCKNTLPSWQVPKDIWIMDAIPLNERGKISRKTLSEQYRNRQSKGVPFI